MAEADVGKEGVRGLGGGWGEWGGNAGGGGGGGDMGSEAVGRGGLGTEGVGRGGVCWTAETAPEAVAAINPRVLSDLRRLVTACRGRDM